MATGQGVLKWVFVFGLFGSGAAAVFFRAHDPSAELERLGAEVSRLQRTVKAPQIIVREVAVPQPSAKLIQSPATITSEAKGDSADEAPELTLEEKRHRVIESSEALSKACDVTYAKESVDPNWSNWAEQTIREKYAGEELKSLRLSVACRTTLCQVDFSYSDPSASLSALHLLNSIHPWAGQQFARIDQLNREGRTYLAREGLDLPMIESGR